MATEETLFDLPIAPDEFGVLLPPADLRRLRYSALDFETARRANVEYIRTYFPDVFNDFVASSGLIMLLEIIAEETQKLSLRGDLLHRQSFIRSCLTAEALDEHLALINQRMRRQTPASVDIEISVESASSTNIEIDAGTRLTTTGPDNREVVYEVYAAPGDFTSSIVLPAGKRGVIAYGLEGAFATPLSFVSSGGAFQTFSFIDETMLESPMLVSVSSGSVADDWRAVSQPIEKYGPNDKVVEVNFIGDKVTFRFGDDVTGKALLSGQTVTISYRSGGGIRGRIGIDRLNETRQISPLPPASAGTQVTFRNPTPSTGGTDAETLEQAKVRAPRDFAVDKSIVTNTDYAHVAESYSHPVFGTVAKAVATLRSSLNANRIDIYCLALGADGSLTAPSAGLKRGLTTFIDDLNVMTDYVVVQDGAVKPVDVDMVVAVNKNADATVVKVRVEQAITDFFDTDNWKMGEPFYVSNLIEAVEGVDGVDYVDLFAPADNVLPSAEQLGPDAVSVGYSEIIVEGQRLVRYYYNQRT